MTFCLGMRVQDGLVGVADTRVTSGSECITARKVSIYQGEDWSVFTMTSGLRSVRDKVRTYFDEMMNEGEGMQYDRIFKVVNLFAEQVRRVSKEDKESLNESGLTFNMHGLIGGQLSGDAAHKLYMVYPEGNWVDVGEGSPYQIIGASGYGKPVLDRTLKFSDSVAFALKVGALAFDSTRISAADVDLPVDVVLYMAGSYHMISQRFEKRDLMEISAWWQDRLRNSVHELSLDWAESLLAKLPATDRLLSSSSKKS